MRSPNRHHDLTSLAGGSFHRNLIMSSTLEATLPAAPAPESKAPARRRPSADLWVYLTITALVPGRLAALAGRTLQGR